MEQGQRSLLHRDNESAIADIRKLYTFECKRLHTALSSNYQKLTSARNAVAKYLNAARAVAHGCSKDAWRPLEATSWCCACCVKFIELVFRCCVFNKLLLHSIHVLDRILRGSANSIIATLVRDDFEAAARVSTQVKRALLRCISHVARSTSISEFAAPLQRYMGRHLRLELRLDPSIRSRCSTSAWPR